MLPIELCLWSLSREINLLRGRESSLHLMNIMRMGHLIQAVQSHYKVFKERQNSDIAINHLIIYSTSGVAHTTLIRDNVCLINNAAKNVQQAHKNSTELKKNCQGIYNQETRHHFYSSRCFSKLNFQHHFQALCMLQALSNQNLLLWSITSIYGPYLW